MHLRITYNGPALTSRQRDPHDLIPALMAVGRLYEAAGYTLIGDVSITARIVGSFHTGSFGLDLRLAGRGYRWYTRREAKALRAIVDGVYDLLRLRQAMGDREVLHVEHRGTLGVVVLTSGAAIAATPPALRLVRSERVVECLAEVLAPLQWDGIDTVAFGTDAYIEAVVKRTDLVGFGPALPLTPGDRPNAYESLVANVQRYKDWDGADETGSDGGE